MEVTTNELQSNTRKRRLVHPDRKPNICPRCKKKEVRKAVLGYPTEEDFHNDNIYLIGCIPDFPIDRTWGCRNCDAGFWKDTPRNKAALGGLVPHQWPKD